MYRLLPHLQGIKQSQGIKITLNFFIGTFLTIHTMRHGIWPLNSRNTIFMPSRTDPQSHPSSLHVDEPLINYWSFPHRILAFRSPFSLPIKLLCQRLVERFATLGR